MVSGLPLVSFAREKSDPAAYMVSQTLKGVLCGGREKVTVPNHPHALRYLPWKGAS